MRHSRLIETDTALSRLRAATASLHRSLEDRFDAVSELANSNRRKHIIARYGLFYRQSYAALAPHLVDIEGLDFDQRGEIWRPFAACSDEVTTTECLRLPNEYAALGALYVVEGSTLGGRLIQRELQKGGVSDPALAFLDPYGDRAGALWRSLLASIERETAGEPTRLDALCSGAVAAFHFADQMLCGETR